MKDLPFAINHATLSPDGKMLVAVGDYNQAYFFTREIEGERVPQIPKPHNRLGAKDVDWVLTNVVSLHVSESTVGYFTTAWSPSGNLVAVGSEGGYITVLDRELLERRDVEDDEAIVAVVPGSRADVPSPYPGAIRSMVFSPEPWDLLCWAEDQGRVCIGDLRTGLKSMQVIQLEPEDEALERLVVEDVGRESEGEVVIAHLDELEEELMRRYGGGEGGEQAPPISSVNFATEYIETRRRQRAARQELAMRQEQRDTLRGLLDSDLQGLTTREHQILETLRTSRQREEARTSGGGSGSGSGRASSITYPTAELFGSNPRSSTRQSGSTSTATANGGTTTSSSSTRPINEILSAVQETLPTLSRIHASATPRPSDTAPTLPPIQFSVTRNSTSNLPRPTEGTSSSSRLPRIQRIPTTRDTGGGEEQPSADDEHRQEEDEENPWRTIEEHMLSPPARGPLFEGASRAPPLNPREEESQRARLSQLRQQRSDHRNSTWRPNTTNTERRGGGENPQRQAREAMILAATLAEARDSRIRGGGAETQEQRDMRLARGPEPMGIEGRYDALFRASMRGSSGMTGREGGVRTAGLAVSEDGAKLWVATEKGIFEVGLRVGGRMFWPSLEMR